MSKKKKSEDKNNHVPAIDTLLEACGYNPDAFKVTIKTGGIEVHERDRKISVGIRCTEDHCYNCWHVRYEGETGGVCGVFSGELEPDGYYEDEWEGQPFDAVLYKRHQVCKESEMEEE